MKIITQTIDNKEVKMVDIAPEVKPNLVVAIEYLKSLIKKKEIVQAQLVSLEAKIKELEDEVVTIKEDGYNK